MATWTKEFLSPDAARKAKRDQMRPDPEGFHSFFERASCHECDVALSGKCLLHDEGSSATKDVLRLNHQRRVNLQLQEELIEDHRYAWTSPRGKVVRRQHPVELYACAFCTYECRSEKCDCACHEA